MVYHELSIVSVMGTGTVSNMTTRAPLPVSIGMIESPLSVLRQKSEAVKQYEESPPGASGAMVRTVSAGTASPGTSKSRTGTSV